MTRRRIYLDCDGVLADFERGAEAVLGMSPDRFTQRFGLKMFWSRLAKASDFFERLELLPDARLLYEAVEHRHPIILTGLPRGGWAEPQKRRWAERHFPGVKVITTSAALKREHCHPGDALVDDNPRYANLWEAEGGIFIRHRSAVASIEALRDLGFLGPDVAEPRPHAGT